MDLTRRQFNKRLALATGGLAAGTYGVGRLLHEQAVPTAVAGVQLISGNRSAGSWTIAAGSTLRFDPNKSTTLTLTGNMVNRGMLDMRPARPDVIHTLRFASVNEAAFRGGEASAPMTSDVGLWVVDGGRLLLRGVDVGGPVAVNGEALGMESRNVRLEGTPAGRSHIFIRTTRPAPQRVEGVAIRYMGVSRPIPQNVEGRKTIVLGRYALHFHRCGDTSRGSVVANTIIRDAENRGFVPHASHGIAFRRAVVYGAVADGFWWDPPTGDDSNASDAILYEDCIAALVRHDPLGVVATGFTFPEGKGNVSRRCRATGVTGQAQSNGNGGHWPRADVLGSWLVEDFVSHHNDQGIFSWVAPRQDVRRARCYANSYRDLSAGAYRSASRYESCSFESVGGVMDNGTSDAAGPLVFASSKLIGPFVIPDVAVDGTAVEPVQVRACQLERGVIVDQPGLNGDAPTSHVFEACTRAGRDLERGDFAISAARPGTRITVIRRDGTSFRVL